MPARVIHSFVCPHCGEEIFPPEGKTLLIRDIQEIRDYMNKKQYWKKHREQQEEEGNNKGSRRTVRE